MYEIKIIIMANELKSKYEIKILIMANELRVYSGQKYRRPTRLKNRLGRAVTIFETSNGRVIKIQQNTYFLLPKTH